MNNLNFRWKIRRLPAPNKKLLARIASRAAELAGLNRGAVGGDWELGVDFVGDRAMIRANRALVGHSGTTDVITFSYFDDADGLFPGEVAVELIICVDVAEREGAKRADSDYAGELTLYLVHGLLHSAGEDDLDDAAVVSMRRREKEVISQLRKEFDFNAVFPHF